MAQHKWTREIHAWADGDAIEIRYRIWLDAGGFKWSKWLIEPKIPNWELSDCEYRIKPQPKEPQYLYVYSHKETSCINYMLKDKPKNMSDDYKYIGKIKLEAEE